jgi:hypothetical protein
MTRDRSIHEEGGTEAGSGVAAWREARLHLAGFDQETASHLAGEEAIDFHALLDLIDHGCPPHLAARILAPLDCEKESC